MDIRSAFLIFRKYPFLLLIPDRQRENFFQFRSHRSERNIKTEESPLAAHCLYRLHAITVRIQESCQFEFPFRSLLHE